MSTLKADAVTAQSTNQDLDLSGNGTGVPDIATGFKVGGTAGLPINNLRVGTDGELITWDASGDPAAVAVGTATHVLTSNGAGTAPTFQAAGGGAWAVIASGTASTVTALDFTSGFTAGKIQKIFIHDLIITAGRVWIFRTSSDGGSSYEDGTNDYTSAFTGVAATTESHVAGSVTGADTYMSAMGYGDALSTATWSALMEVVIQGHGDSSQFTTISWRTNFQDHTPNFRRAEGVGVRVADEVNDAFRLTLDNTSGATFSCKYVHLELN